MSIKKTNDKWEVSFQGYNRREIPSETLAMELNDAYKAGFKAGKKRAIEEALEKMEKTFDEFKNIWKSA